MTELTVIQTADTHGRLREATASRLAALKRRHDALLFDCGDALGTPNYAPAIGVEGIAKVMNRAHFDAMAMGNREYGLLRGMTESKLRPFRFPVLSANLAAGTPTIASVEPSAIFDHGDLTVGVFALSPDMTPSGSLAHRVSGVSFGAAKESAVRAVRVLGAECDLVIALLHWGHSMDEQVELIEAVDGLDLVLAGHMHVTGGSFETINDTPVSRCASHAKEAAILQFDGRDWSQRLVDLQ